MYDTHFNSAVSVHVLVGYLCLFHIVICEVFGSPDSSTGSGNLGSWFLDDVRSGLFATLGGLCLLFTGPFVCGKLDVSVVVWAPVARYDRGQRLVLLEGVSCSVVESFPQASLSGMSGVLGTFEQWLQVTRSSSSCFGI